MLDALGELMMQPAFFSRYGGEPREPGRGVDLAVRPIYRVADGTVSVSRTARAARLLRPWSGGPASLRTLASAQQLADPVARHDELTAVIEESFAGRAANE